ncbi:MAG: hypothetical protein Q4D66_04740, partial [Bacteroidales bacterium]|nr:hypothetical protein [Bacteroidales bacterium]
MIRNNRVKRVLPSAAEDAMRNKYSHFLWLAPLLAVIFSDFSISEPLFLLLPPLGIALLGLRALQVSKTLLEQKKLTRRRRKVTEVGGKFYSKAPNVHSKVLNVHST